MTDHTPDPHDELLRQALRAEADGVVADESLRQRVEAATATAPPRRASRLIAVAAAVAMLAGVGIAVAITQDDDTQGVESIDPAAPTTTSRGPDLDDAIIQRFECAPGTVQLVVVAEPDATAAERDAIGAGLAEPPGAASTSGEGSVAHLTSAEVLELLQAEDLARAGVEAADVPAAWMASYTDPTHEIEVRSRVADLPGISTIGSTDCTETGGDAPQPDVVVAVTGDGRLVVLDVATGDELRELAAYDDPNAGAPEGGPYSISGVALHPNGQDVYFETCCEPAAGAVFRVPIDGSAEPEQILNVFGIDISADGRWVVGTTGAGILLHDLEVGRSSALLGGDDDFLVSAERVAVNADGSEIAVVTVERDADGNVISSGLARYPIEDGQLGEPTSTGGSDGRLFPLYTADQERPGRAMGQGADLAVDASGQWLLEVDEQGAIAVRASDGPVVLSTGPFLAADW
ncbi:MAG: hypothetical protein ACSLFP_06895 [Acidimicrobiales bacterium]